MEDPSFIYISHEKKGLYVLPYKPSLLK